jgi:hypothetical protein
MSQAREGSSRSGWCMTNQHEACQFAGCTCTECSHQEVT